MGHTERDNCMSYVGHYQEGRFITHNSQIPERLTVDKSYENVFYNLTKNITMTLENVKLIFKQTQIQIQSSTKLPCSQKVSLYWPKF